LRLQQVGPVEPGQRKSVELICSYEIAPQPSSPVDVATGDDDMPMRIQAESTFWVWSANAGDKFEPNGESTLRNTARM